MNNISDIKNIYFLGIGGIGMSALARYFHKRGVQVSGYDKTPSELTNALVSEGIAIHFDDDPQKIDPTIDCVVYTPAIAQDNKEWLFLKHKGVEILKRSQMLGLLTATKTSLAIAGTHGKTSTTALLAHILSGQQPITAFIGGIACNFQSNFIDQEGAKTIVVEADEYDRSFLSLHPQIAVITAMDADHLDIYGDKEHLRKSFNDFALNIAHDGYLVSKKELLAKLSVNCSCLTYSFDDNRCDFYAINHHVEEGLQRFDIHTPDGIISDIRFPIAGKHNVENAVAATAVAVLSGIKPNIIKTQLSDFLGVKRRFEYIVRQPDFIYIDDYAHHPKELNACIESAKTMHPGKKITGVFQPHLFSRTRDFVDDFAQSLSQLDKIILLDIYPARELPIEGIDSSFLLGKINNPNKILLSKEDLIPYLRHNRPEVLLTMGAGDIDRLVLTIKQAFEHE